MMNNSCVHLVVVVGLLNGKGRIKVDFLSG